MVAEYYRLPPRFREIPARLNLAQEVLRHCPDPQIRHEPALLHRRGATPYSELGALVGRFAHSLKERGFLRGDRILLRMQNSLEFAVAFLGAVRIGAIPVMQNSLATPGELAYVLDGCEPAGAITLAEIADPLREHAAQLPRGLIVARGATKDELAYEEMVQSQAESDFMQTDANEPAFIVYTSGTTGKPKGIVHAHRWIVALGDSNALRLPPKSGDVVLSTGEWSFIAALGQNLLFPLRNGVRAAALEGRALPERILEAIQSYRVTLLYSVATVYRRLLAIDGFERRFDLSSLRGCNSTGEPLEKATYEEWKKRVGCDIWEHYGISEMQMVFGQGPNLPLKPGSVGIPLPGTTVAVLDDAYNPVPPGTVANLLIKADDPGFFLGYYQNSELTAQVLRNGWYHTGDLASQDKDGYIWMAGRSDDCFKSRGIFISPIEIENVLREHPAVAEACVVPRPDREIGNQIRAVIVPRALSEANSTLAEEIRTSLRGRIAPYKVPHTVEFREALPRSPVGKVLRRVLRDDHER